MDLTEHDAEFVLRNILDGIKELEGLKYDTDTAEYLNATKERINQWKNRKTVPFVDAILWAKNNNTSLSWLLLRKGPKEIEQIGVNEDQTDYQSNKPNKAWDLPLFNKCLNIMNEEANRRGLQLDADSLLKAVAVLYQTVQNNDQEPDMQLVEGLLELAG